MIRVVLDATCMGRGKTGNETYVRGLLEGFTSCPDPRIELFVVVTDAYREGRNSQFQWLTIPDSSFWLRHYHYIPRVLMQVKPDIYHGVYWAPRELKCKLVLTVHDVSFMQHPEWFPWYQIPVYQNLVGRSVAHADVILTLSEFSKTQIQEVWGLADDMVHVHALAAGKQFVPGANREHTESPYFLSVGNLHPRKNLIKLIRAFRTFQQQHRNFRLKIAGPQGWKYRDLLAEGKETAGVEFLGAVSSKELVQLYQQAEAFIFPSLYEGFGLPLLEAMACGCPVLASDIPVFKEVAQSAALYFNPHDEVSISTCLRKYVQTPEIHDVISDLSRERLKAFQWSKTAQIVSETYTQLFDCQSMK